MTTVSRRTLIEALVATALAGASGAWTGGEETLEQWIRAHLPGSDLAELGRAYRAANPSGASGAALVRRIVDGRRHDEPVAALIARKVTEDFTSGRVVDLAGWRLAETEARLIGLATN